MKVRRASLVVVLALSLGFGTAVKIATAKSAQEDLSQASGGAQPAAVATPEASSVDSPDTDVVQKKATCPFIGTAVALKRLLVLNGPSQPLASIDAAAALGNTGGGDLGEVLKAFAQGNHAFMPGASGKLDRPVPAGLFSLDFPGSQGSHPGHSGILQGDPKALDSGRFSRPDFDRLIGRAKGGWVKRSDVGKFIAENLVRDPNSKVFAGRVAKLLASDLVGLVGAAGDERKLLEALTKTTGEDNLVGSSGEFGLLFAFLSHEPGARQVDGEPAVSVADLTAMFRDKKFPAGWEAWPKTSHDWVVNTTGLMIAAGHEYLRLKH
jgi:hypothetical protein